MLSYLFNTIPPAASTNTLTVVTNPADSDGFADNRSAVTVGNNQVLRCVGSGSSSPPSVVWVRNGEQVVAGSRIAITETMPGAQQRSSELQITNFSLSDAGVYQCIFTEDAAVITTRPLRLDSGLCPTLLMLWISLLQNLLVVLRKIQYPGTFGSHIYPPSLRTRKQEHLCIYHCCVATTSRVTKS